MSKRTESAQLLKTAAENLESLKQAREVEKMEKSAQVVLASMAIEKLKRKLK